MTPPHDVVFLLDMSLLDASKGLKDDTTDDPSIDIPTVKIGW